MNHHTIYAEGSTVWDCEKDFGQNETLTREPSFAIYMFIAGTYSYPDTILSFAFGFMNGRCLQQSLLEAGGVHIIQAFFSDDTSEEVQIQGRTSRQGKSGTYSLILAESEANVLKMPLSVECYRGLYRCIKGSPMTIATRMTGLCKPS